MGFVTYYQFQQTKRYFHISALDISCLSTAQQYTKLEPLASMLCTKFQAYVILRQNVSFNEMMVPFSRRSQHTLKMKNKLITKGFKVQALCEHRYLQDFLFYLCISSEFIYIYIIIISKLSDIGTVGLQKHPELSATHSAVFQLMKTLPYSAYQFTLFCDNLFENPKLFSLLRSLGIGACGTAQQQVTKPVFGNIDEWKAAWGSLRLKVEHTTLVSIQQDSNKVGFCTTIHNRTEWPLQN